MEVSVFDKIVRGKIRDEMTHAGRYGMQKKRSNIEVSIFDREREGG